MPKVEVEVAVYHTIEIEVSVDKLTEILTDARDNYDVADMLEHDLMSTFGDNPEGIEVTRIRALEDIPMPDCEWYGFKKDNAIWE